MRSSVSEVLWVCAAVAALSFALVGCSQNPVVANGALNHAGSMASLSTGSASDDPAGLAISKPITNANWTAIGSGANGAVAAIALVAPAQQILQQAGTQVLAQANTQQQSQASDNAAGLSTTQQQLSTGLKINSAADSAAAPLDPIYIGGSFTAVSGVAASYVAMWNGAKWMPLGSGMNGIVYALAVDASGNLYAGGGFTMAGGVKANNIAMWNGSAWSAVGNGTASTVYALAIDQSGNLYEGGWSPKGVQMWNGSTWSAVGSGINGCVNALTFDQSGNLYAGGTFTMAGGVSANNIAMWNGGAWSALGSGTNAQVQAIAIDAKGNVFAGGRFSSAGGIIVNNVAYWNGSGWICMLGGMSAGSIVSSLACDGNGNLYAGGYFASVGGTSVSGVKVNNIAQWNGSVWNAMGSGTTSSVNALAYSASTGNLFTGGMFGMAGGRLVSYLAAVNVGASTQALQTADSTAQQILQLLQ